MVTFEVNSNELNQLKQLASDTVIYGLSSILGRVIFVLLSRLYTNTDILSIAENGVYTGLFTLSSFLLVIFGYGLETAFFRFALKEDNNLQRTTATALTSILVSTVSLGILCILFSSQIAAALQFTDYVQLVQFVILIVCFDTLTSIPFAYLRATHRPLKFAFVKLSGILINVGLNLFFYLYCPYVMNKGESHVLYDFINSIYNPNFGVGYAFLANLVDSCYKLLILSPIFTNLKYSFDTSLLKKMIQYGWPIMFILFGSMINEVADRQLLLWLLPSEGEYNREQAGIYQNCYKLSIFLALFTQAFRYAGEPFFFARAKEKDAKQTYANVLKYFTIFSLLGFLFVSLNLNALKHIIITDSVYFQGLQIVPILLLAYVFAGMYYNLSIWYKLTDNTKYGAIVAFVGAAVTIGINVLFIPKYGYMASAWATFACFFVMCVVAYFWGQKEFPVPYKLGELLFYFGLAFALFFIGKLIINQFAEQSVVRYAIQLFIVFCFIAIAFFKERKQLSVLLGNQTS